jgi:hypothetical protein
MSTQMTDAELKKLIFDIVKKANVENAAHTKPVYSLAEILAFRNVAELRELAKILEVKSYSKLRKSELISALAEKMQMPDILRDFFYTISKIEWDFFQEVAAQKYLITEKAYIDAYLVLQRMGLLQSFLYEDKMYFVVPEEIKATYLQLLKTNFLEEKRFRYLVNDYAIACVSLYGVISQDDFVELFNSQNERQTTIDEVFSILLNYVFAEEGYCFWEEYIVDDEFEEEDFVAVKWLVEERKGKPRYTPPREELLRYSDWDYYEVTPQVIALKNFLANFITNPHEIEDLLLEIHDLSVAGMEMQEYFDLLESAGIEFENNMQAQKMIQLIVDVQNNTRQWENYGHTPRELTFSNKSNVIPFPPPNLYAVKKSQK